MILVAVRVVVSHRVCDVAAIGLTQTRTMALWPPVVNRKERTIHLDWITEHWDRIGQFFAAFASGQTTASVALKRLVGHGPKNRFYRATRELGRLGRLDQRDFERQTGAASCLLRILAAIIYWQIRGDRSCFERGGLGWPDDLNFELLSHSSRIGWDNVLLYGEYQLNRSLVRSERGFKKTKPGDPET